MRFLLLLFFLSSCTPGMQFFNCEKEEYQSELVANEFFPSTILDRIDVFCREKENMPPQIACYIDWYGSSQVYRGRFIVDNRFVDRCVLHEAYHAQLHEKFGDACHSHEKSCNWHFDYLELSFEKLEVDNAF